MKKLILTAVAALALQIQGHASLVVATNSVSGNYTNAFPISATDLINTGTPTLAGVATFGYTPFSAFSSTSTVAALNDGTGGTLAPAANGCLNEAAFDLDGVWTNVFSLNTALAPLGYDITNISTIAAWIANRAAQKYELLYSTVSNTNFVSLGTFAYDSTVSGSSRIQITGGGGPIATHVSAIRFDFMVPNLGGGTETVYKEIDVFGQPVPEPGAWLLALSGLLAALRMRR